MNYSNELNTVNNKIETLQAELNQLLAEKNMLTQLIDMKAKMEELERKLSKSEPVEVAQPVSETPILSVVRNEPKEEVSEMIINNTTVSNEKCTLTINIDKKEISGDDHTDEYNRPRCYNSTFRSHKKAWKALKSQFTKDTTMYEACGILRANGVKMRTYCSMD